MKNEPDTNSFGRNNFYQSFDCCMQLFLAQSVMGQYTTPLREKKDEK